jgi:glutaconate CoA-transferase, subunit B
MSQVAYPGTDRYSMAELMAIVWARNLAGDEEKTGGGGGAAQAIIPMAAGRLAQLTVAPNLWLRIGGAGVWNSKFDTLPLGSWDPRCLSGAESMLPMMEVVDSGTRGYRPGESGQGPALGGMQIDKFGNTNMIGIGGPYPNLKVRGPGTVGTIWLSRGPSTIFLEHHNRRVFVDKVDYISGPGWLTGGDSRYKVLNGRPGPQRVYTPICYCDFTEDEHRMRLLSVHPGYTVQDVIDNTGFELVIPDDVPTTTPPTDWELEMLRTRVDSRGQLRKRRVTAG